MTKEECRIYMKNYLAANKVRRNEARRLYRNAKKTGTYVFTRKCDHPSYDLWQRAKKRAKKFGRDFNLNLDDIIIPEYCPILGIRLESCSGYPKNCSPSLDRINNSKGYIRGNVGVISHLANKMKREMSPEIILAMAEWVKQGLKSDDT